MTVSFEFRYARFARIAARHDRPITVAGVTDDAQARKALQDFARVNAGGQRVDELAG